MEEYRFLWAPVVIFVAGFFLLRLAGKRAVANMSSFDLFVVAAMGAALGGSITVPGSLSLTLLGVLMLVLTYLGWSYLMLNKNMRVMMVNKPSVLVHKGHISETGMRDARITIPELLGHLRLKGYPSLTDVEFAIMEEAGEISVIPKASARPLQPGDLQLHVQPTPRPVPVIIDGDWIEDNLLALGSNKNEVIMKLQAQGVLAAKIKELTLVTLDEQGTVWYDAQDASVDGQKAPQQYASPQQALTAVLAPEARQATEKNKAGK
ncbi:uncharacterized membrane protein YcaP (DUF421 family) [Tumebacillus sp. BK434]|uniref:DUF421 domain-containing protein n=1 Tax=Tumebacillus sp. BK434 TaxID=2512169 RepID=UPI00104BFC3A|nr:DUF421 domain-containing protein [Tumebacillus sp. BK434]TCP52855.1 uncharacterized membrane protein YcaP (DUF421 family) [Tumebacillus sp. BK434]